MKNRRIGVGIIARDFQGQVVATRSLTLHVHTDPLVTETWVALHAVLFAKESGLLDIILEGDALQVVIEINSVIPSLSMIRHFTDGIISELYSLRSFHVLYVKIEANSAAHVLTKATVFHVGDSTRFMLEETPPHVSDIVFKKSLCP